LDGPLEVMACMHPTALTINVLYTNAALSRISESDCQLMFKKILKNATYFAFDVLPWGATAP